MNGFYNVIKPIGKSSSDLVIKIRGILRRTTGQKIKVGHLGTLDPQATGVLGVAVGSATKLFDHFLTKRKTYIATCVLGKQTDTLDAVGKVTAECAVPIIEDDVIRETLQSFLGEIDQIPPKFSAKSIDGVRAYRLAMKGVEPELKPCKVTIYDIILEDRPQNDTFRFRVTCSGGTYIRSLCRDIGFKLGCYAYMGALERVQNGTMRIEDAVTLEDIEKDILSGFTSLEQFSASLDRTEFSEEMRVKVENGVKQTLPNEDGLVSVFIGGAFYGIGCVTDHVLKMVARDV